MLTAEEVRLPGRLHAAIAAVCPIVGVSIDDPAQRAVTIHPAPEATEAERAAAAAALAEFNWDEPSADGVDPALLGRFQAQTYTREDVAELVTALAARLGLGG